MHWLSKISLTLLLIVLPSIVHAADDTLTVTDSGWLECTAKNSSFYLGCVSPGVAVGTTVIINFQACSQDTQTGQETWVVYLRSRCSSVVDCSNTGSCIVTSIDTVTPEPDTKDADCWGRTVEHTTTVLGQNYCVYINRNGGTWDTLDGNLTVTAIANN